MTLPVVDVETGLGPLLWVAAGMVTALAVLHGLIARFTADISTEVLESTRRQATRAYLSASWPVQAHDREGALQETVSTLALQSSTLALWLIQGASAALSLLAILLTSALVDVTAMLIVVALGVGIFVVLRPISRLTNRAAKRFVAANSDYVQDVSRAASMSLELRVFGVEDAVFGDLQAANLAVAERHRASRFISRFGSTLYRDLAVLLLVGAVALLGSMSDDRTDAIGAVVLLVVRALAYATMVQSSLQLVNEQSPNLSTLLDRLRVLEDGREANGVLGLDTVGEIRVESVSFEYTSGRSTLHDVTLTLQPGEVVGLVGPSGSGKSTLLHVVLRLLRPTSGTIKVGGVDYLDLSSDSWARAIAFVPQEPKLIEGSVAENIRFFRPWISAADVEAAAESAHVAGDVRQMRDGFDSLLGPRGAGLSGGQKQRIAIARALVGRPQLLILDEPTSALDGGSEALIQETIQSLRGDLTILIVAHRLTTLDVCDRVLTVADGGISAGPGPDAEDPNSGG